MPKYMLDVEPRLALDFGLGADPKPILGVSEEVFTSRKCRLAALKLNSRSPRRFHPKTAFNALYRLALWQIS